MSIFAVLALLVVIMFCYWIAARAIVRTQNFPHPPEKSEKCP